MIDPTLYEKLLCAFKTNDEEPSPETVAHVWSLFLQIPKETYASYANLRYSVIGSLRQLLTGQAIDVHTEETLAVGLSLADYLSDVFVTYEASEEFEANEDDDEQFSFLITLPQRVEEPDEWSTDEERWICDH